MGRHLWVLFIVLLPHDLAGQGGAHWAPRLELRIGSKNDPETAFTRPSVIAVAHGGMVFSLHPGERCLRVWDQEGHLVRELGGRGAGPGELSRPSARGTSGGSVWVYDVGNSRFTLWDQRGEVVSTRSAEPLLLDIRGLYHWPSSLLVDGSLLGVQRVPSAMIAEGLVGALTFVRQTFSAELIDTVATLSIANRTLIIEDPERLGQNGNVFTSQPFTDSPLLVVAPDGSHVFIVHREVHQPGALPTFRIVKQSILGGTVFDRVLPYRPRELADSTVDRTIRTLLPLGTRLTGSEETRFARAEVLIRSALFRPDFHPPVSGAVPSTDGGLWIRREDEGTATVLWEALGPTGERSGSVRLPRSVRVLAVDGWEIWGIELDDLDIPSIVKYGIHDPGGGTPYRVLETMPTRVPSLKEPSSSE